MKKFNTIIEAIEQETAEAEKAPVAPKKGKEMPTGGESVSVTVPIEFEITREDDLMSEHEGSTGVFVIANEQTYIIVVVYPDRLEWSSHVGGEEEATGEVTLKKGQSNLKMNNLAPLVLKQYFAVEEQKPEETE